MLLRHPVEDHELNLQFGSAERRLQPWYDTIAACLSLHLTAYDGARWLPVREFPLSSGGAYAQLATAAFAGKLAAGLAQRRPQLRRPSRPHVANPAMPSCPWRTGAPQPKPCARRGKRPISRTPRPPSRPTLARVRARPLGGQGAPQALPRRPAPPHRLSPPTANGTATSLFAYRYALDAGALDFLRVTDHSGAERAPLLQISMVADAADRRPCSTAPDVSQLSSATNAP